MHSPANLAPELIRTATIKLEPGARYVVDKLLCAPGDELTAESRLVEVKATRTKRQGDRSVDQTVVETHGFAAGRHAGPRVLRHVVEPGQALEPGEVAVLDYQVEDSFANRIELVVRGMVTKPSDLHATGALPDGKLQKAIAHYAGTVDPARVLFLYDDTVFGSAKDGFLITDSGFYYNNIGKKLSLRFSELQAARLEAVSTKPSDKPSKRVQLRIGTAGGELVVGDDWPGLDLTGMERFLNHVITLKSHGHTKEVDGFVIVEEMPEPVRAAYLALLVWLTHQDDGTIDERELSELQVLMTQLDCGPELRHQVRSHISDPAGLDAEALVRAMLAETPSGSELALAGSLIKDAVRVVRATSKASAADQPGIVRLAQLLGISAAQVAFIEEACIQDERIMDGELSDDQITAAAKGMAAKASAVGVPIAAIYLSGSVTGLSAAGVTSGLATLGLGGVLGLSSMVTGIGVAIILGVGIYKGMQWLMGGNERDKASRRELMLQEVLRVHQKAIANLAEDVAFFGRQMVELTVDVEKNKLLIGKLSRELGMFAEAMARLRSKETGFEGELRAEIDKRVA